MTGKALDRADGAADARQGSVTDANNPSHVLDLAAIRGLIGNHTPAEVHRACNEVSRDTSLFLAHAATALTNAADEIEALRAHVQELEYLRAEDEAVWRNHELVCSALAEQPLETMEGRHLAKDALPCGETLPDTLSEPSAVRAVVQALYDFDNLGLTAFATRYPDWPMHAKYPARAFHKAALFRLIDMATKALSAEGSPA